MAHVYELYRHWWGKRDYCMRQEHRADEKVEVGVANLQKVDTGGAQCRHPRVPGAPQHPSHAKGAEITPGAVRNGRRPNALPLPQRSYEYAEWYKAKVNVDHHIEADHHYYSMPFRLLRENSASD